MMATWSLQLKLTLAVIRFCFPFVFLITVVLKLEIPGSQGRNYKSKGINFSQGWNFSQRRISKCQNNLHCALEYIYEMKYQYTQQYHMLDHKKCCIKLRPFGTIQLLRFEKHV